MVSELHGDLVAVDCSTDWDSNAHYDANNPIDENGNPGGVYTRSWCVKDNDHPDPATDTISKTITMKVEWNDAWGVEREVTMDYEYYIAPSA